MVCAVTFDFWNTLCYEPPGGYLRGRRLEAMGEVLVAAGVGDAGPPSSPRGGDGALAGSQAMRSQLFAAYDSAWIDYHEAWVVNRQYTGGHAADAIVRHLDATFGLNEAVRRDLLDAFAGAAAADDVSLHLVDGVIDVLEALAGQDVHMAIVCDVGLTGSDVLRLHLERHGVLGYFDHWAFSDEVGVYKPDARIFRHALAGLGSPDPSTCVHVGDRRRTDVAGAMAMGMTAVRLNAVFDDDDPGQGPSGDVVVSHYGDLLPALGLARAN